MIYIATHHRVINFGAVLQSYALQQYLNSLGYENKLILVDKKNIVRKQKNIPRLIYKKFQNIYKKIYRKDIEKCEKNFNDFFENYHKTTRMYKDYDELKQNPPTDGMYLSGSDQVFNPLNDMPHFFLKFGAPEIKRISYAASVGINDIPQSHKDSFRESLAGFDAISIREEYSKELVKKYYNGDVNVHVDPSYLIQKSEWKKIANNNSTKKLKKPYILVYAIYRPKWLSKYLKKIKHELKCDIVLVSYGSFVPLYHDYYVKDAGPREFLDLVDNAKMIISSSYHGNVFATIFKKPFYAVVNPDSPARIMSMLELFNLKDRVLTPDTKINLDIDYRYMENKLSEEIERTREYLKKAVEEQK